MDLKKVNQMRLAEGIGVNRSRISLWLAQKTKEPRRETLQKLSEFFGCSIDWLAEGKGEPFPSADLENAEKITDFQPAKMAKEVEENLKKISRIQFKMNCSGFLDEFFDYIADNYGESKEGVDAFLTEFYKTHSNYRVWLQEKKEDGDSGQSEGRKSLAGNGE